jgi:hypothetical protein
MATEAQLLAGLKAADAAGNTADAQHFADQIKAMRAASAPEQQPDSVPMDMLKSFGTKAVKSITGLAGMAGDASKALQNVTGWHLGNVAGLPIPVPLPASVASAPLPTSQALDQTVFSPFGGEHKPQSMAGEYAGAVGAFLPNAIAPGGIGARAARVLAPALLSETAGQLTKGTTAEPWARGGAAMIGGVGEGLAEGLLTPKTSQPWAPTLDQLKQAKDVTYKAADQAGVVISPNSFQQFASDLGRDLTKNNVVQADIHKNALSALQIIQDEAASGAPLSLARADAIRQAVGHAAEQAAGPNANGGDLRLVMKVKDGLDKYLDGIGPQDVLTGDPATAVPILKEARALAQREFKATEIQKLIDLAEADKSRLTQSGYENALRQQFRNLQKQFIKDPTRAAAFTEEERDAIAKVANGDALGNALRWLGKWAPTGVIPAAGGAYLSGGPAAAGLSALVVPAIGAAARHGATNMTSRNAEMAAALMRSGPAMAQAPATVTQSAAQWPALSRQILLSTLLSQQGAR